MSESYLIYGRRPVQEYLSGSPEPRSIEAIYLSESFPAKLKREYLGRLRGVSLREFPKRKMDDLFPGVNHQGVVLKFVKGARPSENRSVAWTDTVAQKEGLLVALDRIQDPQNLGSIIRSAESLGARALFITGKGAGLSPVVDRASAGASFHLEIHTMASLDRLMDAAKEAGYWVCVSALLEGEDLEEMESHGHRRAEAPLLLSTEDLSELPESSSILLIVGSEGEGVRELTLKKADYVLTIPLRGKTSSLNAGVAAGILIDRILNRPLPHDEGAG